MIKINNKEKFASKVINAKGVHVVRFCAVWSGPCQIMAPIYEEMSVLYKNKISFYKIDVDEAPLLKEELGIIELPTFLFYKDGLQVDFITGLISKSLLNKKLEDIINC